MSDPFFGLNINNLQTISAANNTRLHDMNHSMTKPLMSSHLPQLPQQQMKTSAPNQRPETTEEELDERKKFEKYRKFQIQQKRLQEMSFSSGVPASSNSSADKLMANLIQKVESEAKIDKRIQNSHKTGVQVYNQPIGQPSVISSAVQSPNRSLYTNHLGTVGQQNAVALQPMYLSGQQLPQQQNSNYFNSFYPLNQMSKNSIQQMTTTGLESISHSTLSSVSDEFKGGPQQMASNQTMTSMNPITDFNLSSNSGKVFLTFVLKLLIIERNCLQIQYFR